MRALLDTHTFLWWNLNDPQLSQSAHEFIKDESVMLYALVLGFGYLIGKIRIKGLELISFHFDYFIISS